jgi:hypothetical protein
MFENIKVIFFTLINPGLLKNDFTQPDSVRVTDSFPGHASRIEMLVPMQESFAK